MENIAELCIIVGKLEGSVSTLFHNQNKLVASVEKLNALLRKRVWWDSAKIIGGAFAGGATAVVAKLCVWN